MSRIRWYGPTALLLVTVILAMAVGPSLVRAIATSYEDARISQIRHGLETNKASKNVNDQYVGVAEVIRKNTVSITLEVEGNASRSGVRNYGGGGSGWVYRYYHNIDEDPTDYDDYIITNYHVIKDVVNRPADKAFVYFYDGGEYEAKVLGFDALMDIAVLEIEQRRRTAMPLAQGPVRQGEKVFAMGSPFGFAFTMSEGIVSAIGRRVHHDKLDNYEYYIQTDAAINPGNSGGPLVNLTGELVGMNTLIATDGNPEKSFNGIGYAIPTDQIIPIADQIIQELPLSRGFIGVRPTDIDYRTRRAMGLGELKGVLCEPMQDSPADRAGMQLGDIVTHVNGRPVLSTEHLRIQVSSHRPGTKLPIRVWRQGTSIDLSVPLAGKQTSFNAKPDAFEPSTDSPIAAAGLTRFRSFTPTLAQYMERAYHPGVQLMRVEVRSAAHEMWLYKGMILTQVNGQSVHDVRSLGEALKRFKDQPLTLTLKHWDPEGQGRFETKTVTLPAPPPAE